jgi:Mrp family chromosome partitioning ATPase
MSRTFDVLERVQQDQELFRVPPVKREMPASGRSTNANGFMPDVGAFADEEVLRLVQRLFLASEESASSRPRQVVLCGIDDTSGSRQLCVRVGRCLAQQVQSRVCVVDADVHVLAPNPLFDLLSADKPPGSCNEAAGVSLRQVTDNLWLASREPECTSGTPPTLDQMCRLIKDLGDDYDHVIISAPQVGLYNDAALLGQMSDGVVLVLEANATRRVAARRAQQALLASNVRVLGTVLNNRTYPIPERVYRLL